MRRTIGFCAVLMIVLVVLALPVMAQAPTPTLNQINEVARELWCPLCNGVRLDNCDLQACIQMREVIAEKLIAGESTEQIKAYFVEQYGDVVLGTPSRSGFNLIVWLFPVLAVVVGLGWVAYLVAMWRRRQPARQPVPAAAASGPAVSDDDYLKRVEQELKQIE